MKKRGWTPPEGYTLVDWGAGTAVAAERLLASFPAAKEAILDDLSPLSVAFSERKIAELHPNILLKKGSPSAPYVLLISHVLNEIDGATLGRLKDLILKSDTTIWVEPGTFELSRRLIAIRRDLLPRMSVLAPCPHQGRCGLESKENERHWCHHFAEVPSEVFQDGDWKKFSDTLHIDLRSLPVSYLVLTSRKAGLEPPPPYRMIGRPRLYKGDGKFLLCSDGAVNDQHLVKSKHKALFKKVDRPVFSLNLGKDFEIEES